MMIALSIAVFSRARLSAPEYMGMTAATALLFSLSHISRPKKEDGGIYNLISSMISGIFKTITFILVGITKFFNFVNEELEPFTKGGEDQDKKSNKKE